MASPIPFDPPVTMATIRRYRIYHQRMSIVAIIGAGALGGALAHTLAGRGRVDEVRLIDPRGTGRRGQGARHPAVRRPSSSGAPASPRRPAIAAAAGADVIVFADLDLRRRDRRRSAGSRSSGRSCGSTRRRPCCLPAAPQRELMALTLPSCTSRRGAIVGSAPLALESSVRAVAAALLDAQPRRSRPSAWPASRRATPSSAGTPQPRSISRSPPCWRRTISRRISSRLPALWPPAPYTLGSAAARVAEALVHGSRRRYTCFAAVDAGGAGRSLIAAVPVELVKGGIGRTLDPTLSRHERTAFENGLR